MPRINNRGRLVLLHLHIAIQKGERAQIYDAADPNKGLFINHDTRILSSKNNLNQSRLPYRMMLCKGELNLVYYAKITTVGEFDIVDTFTWFLRYGRAGR